MAVRFLKVCNTECGYAEIHAECGCAECRYAECYTINLLLVRFRLARKQINRNSSLDLYSYLCDLF